MRILQKGFICLLNATTIAGFLVQNVRRTASISLKSSSTAEDPPVERIPSSASKLTSVKFVQLTKQTEPALLADYLMEIGASSVAITDHDVTTENESPIYAEPSPGDDIDIFASAACGDIDIAENVWLRCDATAHFGDSYDALTIVDNVRTYFDLGASPRLVFQKDYVVALLLIIDWTVEFH